MKSGLLWYDSDPQRALEDKIRRAAQRYRDKFGRLPSVCYVNPKAIEGRPDGGPALSCRLDDPKVTIRVVCAGNILVHHFWLGEA